MGKFFWYLPLIMFVPVVTGLIRYATLDRAHRIFLFYLLAGSLVQAISLFTPELTLKPLWQYAGYAISFFLLFSLLVHWDDSFNRKKIYKIMAAVSPLVFVFELVIRMKNLIIIPSYGFVAISLLFCLMAMPVLTNRIAIGNIMPWKNSVVLILFPLLTVLLLLDIIYLVYLLVYTSETHLLLKQSFEVNRYTVLFSHLTYTIAIIWAPKKQVFI